MGIFGQQYLFVLIKISSSKSIKIELNTNIYYKLTHDGNGPNRFSRYSPEATPNDVELVKRSELSVPIAVLKKYKAKTPKPKGAADDQIKSQCGKFLCTI